MVKLAGALSRFRPISALVIGDFMLDTYTTGRVKRISPEAPVPVLEVQSQHELPGGAGNVVLNLCALGAKVVVAGRIGSDAAGERLKQSLNRSDIDLRGLLEEQGYKTPVKNRLIADSQQILRVDSEMIAPISERFEEQILAWIEKAIPGVQVIALSDYAKGFLTKTLIAEVIRLAGRAKVPVIVDPKGIDFAKYRGATILKPNLSEAYAAVKGSAQDSLDRVAKEIFSLAEIEWLLITRSEAGISLYNRDLERQDFPVRSKEVKDVTGAGDTVLAMISAAIANQLNLSIATPLANIAAGIAIERIGCAQVTLSEVARRLLESDAGTKIFDDVHAFALHQVLQDIRYILLVLESGQSMSHVLFCALKELSSRQVESFIVYVRGASAEEELVQFLSSLQEVDYILLGNGSLQDLCGSIAPQESYYFENGKLRKYTDPQAMLKSLCLKQKSLV